MPLRIGVIGCGKIADGHVEEIQKLPDAYLAAVCDLEPLMAEQLSVRYQIPKFYGDVDEMLAAERLDVVHITTPPQSHLALTQKAVRAGCHIFAEKPLALNHDDAVRLVDTVIRGGRKMTINYWPNFDPPGLELRRLVASGVIGDPIHLESYLGYNLTGMYGEALLGDGGHWVHRLPGKLFQNILDHILNKITPFIPDEDPRLEAIGYRRRPLRHDPTDAVLDELRVVIHGQNVSAYATLSSHARPVGHFLRLYGTRNTVHVDYNNRIVTLDADQKFPSAIGRLLPAFTQARRYLHQARRNVAAFRRSEFHYFAGMNELIRLFYDSVRNDTPVPIPYDEILRVSAWMDRIFAQVYPTLVTV